MPKTAIVTGASRGIGKAVAKRLARNGFAVVVNYASNAREAEATVAEIKADGGQAIAVKADVGNASEVEQIFDQTVKAFESIDVVVNNSGIMPLSPIGKGDAALFDKVIQSNLRGTFLVMAQAAQRMVVGGRIIAFSSSVLARSFPSYGPYIASKASVEGLVHVLANEMRGRSITVNAVAPGPVGTELFLSGKSDEQITELAKLAPLERLVAHQMEQEQPKILANRRLPLHISPAKWAYQQSEEVRHCRRKTGCSGCSANHRSIGTKTTEYPIRLSSSQSSPRNGPLRSSPLADARAPQAYRLILQLLRFVTCLLSISERATLTCAWQTCSCTRGHSMFTQIRRGGCFIRAHLRAALRVDLLV